MHLILNYGDSFILKFKYIYIYIYIKFNLYRCDKLNYPMKKKLYDCGDLVISIH